MSMFVTPLGIETFVRLEQPANTLSPRCARLGGRTILVRRMQLAKALQIPLTPFPIATLVRLMQEWNAPALMMVTLSGIVTSESLTQPIKALPPMLMTPSEITRLVRFAQDSKALPPISETPLGMLIPVIFEQE